MRSEKEVRERLEKWRKVKDLWDPYDYWKGKLPKEFFDSLRELGYEDPCSVVADCYYFADAVILIIEELEWVLGIERKKESGKELLERLYHEHHSHV